MRDETGRDARDADEPVDGDHSGEDVGADYWDETMLPGAAEADTAGGADDAEPDGDEEPSGNVAGEFSPAGPIEPGNPNLENALFVIAGAYVAVLGLMRLFAGPVFDGQFLLVLTGGVLLVGIVFLGFFGVLTPDT